MIVKMKFINISGPRTDIDRVTEQYLSKYEIQLESALSELKTVDNLRPFVELNPYRDTLAIANQFVGLLEKPDDVIPDTSLGLDGQFEIIRKTNDDYLHLQEKKKTTKRTLKYAATGSETLRHTVLWIVSWQVFLILSTLTIVLVEFRLNTTTRCKSI